jgi:hypothetical protein
VSSTHGRELRTGFWYENLKERDQYEDVGDDDIKMYLREIGRRCGLHSSGSGYGPVAGSCEHGNESSGSIMCWDLFPWVIQKTQPRGVSYCSDRNSGRSGHPAATKEIIIDK